MVNDFEVSNRFIVPPVYVTTTPSLFKHIRPHPMPLYKPHSPQEECIPYACIPYQKDECCKFR
jgi:hypothetical protein